MKFYHIADVHLGAAPDQGYPWSQERGREIWESFRRVIENAGREGIELLLIAGDLFHRQPLMRELKEVNYLFSTIAKTQIVLIAGNHDYLKRDSYYRGFPWNDNVHFIEESSCRKLVFDSLGISVYGLSYHMREIKERLYDGLHPDEDGNFSILLAHGGDERHIPFDKRRLLESGFSYIALGHIHKPQMLAEHRMGYAGALEPLDKNDQGAHGFLEGTLEKNRLHVRFLPWASREYRTIEIQADPAMTDYALREAVRKKIRELGESNIYRILVTGFRDPDILFHMAGCQEFGCVIEAVDETEPYYDLEKLLRAHENDIVGRYIREFLKKPVGTMEKKALYYGIQALLGGRG